MSLALALPLLLQAAPVVAVPWFERVMPTEAERIALPHLGDAVRARDPAQRRDSLDAAVALLPAATPFRGAVQCMRGSILLSIDAVANKAAGTAAIAECYRLNPQAPMAQRQQADVLLMNRDYPAGAALLARAIAADRRLAYGLTRDGLDGLFRQLGYDGAVAERRALVTALSSTDVARDDPALYSGWVRETILDRVAHGDTAAAAQLLPYVVDPSDGLAMLVDRRYEPLWPRLDDWAGGTLVAQRDALLAGARAAYEARPGLTQALLLARVLERTGHVGEAADLLGRAIAPINTGTIPQDDYDYARAVVRLSGLIADAGERDAARILAPMQTALRDGIRGPMLVNVVPNLSRLQIALGQPQAALATLDRYPVDEGKVEARGALAWFVALRGCAQARSGDAPAARAALAQVERRYANSQGAIDMAIGCIGSADARLARWIAQVDDPDTRTGALMAMYAVQAHADDGEALPLSPDALREIADRPQVAERLAKYGRAPAASYRPAMRGWRASP